MTLWSLTLFALIPSPHLGLVLLGAAANLAANGIALYLLISRCKADRVHGFVRLALQVVILAVGAVVVARSGITIDGFLHYFSHSMK
jgi:predicted membrane-bound spermidine synthase